MLDGKPLLFRWRENVLSVATHVDYLLCEQKAKLPLSSRARQLGK